MQPITIPLNLTEALLISHLIRSIIGRGLILQIQRSRFAAPHAQRSKLKASVNNALLGCI